MAKGDHTVIAIYYNHRLVNDVADLSFQGVELQEDLGGGIYHIALPEWEDGVITYAKSDKLNTVTISNALPELGAYSALTASKDNYLTEISVSDLTDDTFYLIDISEWHDVASIAVAGTPGEQAKVMACSFDKGQQTATVKLDREKLDYDQFVEFDVVFAGPDGHTDQGRFGIRVVNAVKVQVEATATATSSIAQSETYQNYTDAEKQTADAVITALTNSSNIRVEQQQLDDGALRNVTESSDQVAESEETAVAAVEEVQIAVDLAIEATGFDVETGTLTLDITPTVTCIPTAASIPTRS